MAARSKPIKSKSAVVVSAKPAAKPVAPKKAVRLVFRKSVVLNSGNAIEVGDLRKRLGLSRKLLSRLSGYSERAVAEWEAGKALGTASKQRMIELSRLQQGLARVMAADFIPAWLQTPNDALGGLKPLEVVERGEADRLWSLIYRLESGVPS
jgi:transcriptional regulator with XRE-family HTH domain